MLLNTIAIPLKTINAEANSSTLPSYLQPFDTSTMYSNPVKLKFVHRTHHFHMQERDEAWLHTLKVTEVVFTISHLLELGH